ncbi:TPA: PIN domain-containing protein [Candidatus Woesearchaeota archaeon]|nr:PIN domain-containing protein [Candidatus Woesearchaeota archaeon]HII89131.1 PIN domain-containing protein [Candidatus Woesearchaeota archaeon]
MNYIDSWILIELFLEGEKAEKVLHLLEKIRKERIVMSAIALFELKYHLTKKSGKERTEQILAVLEQIEEVAIAPILSQTCLLAAELRLKYYTKERQISVADALHLATAMQTGCKAFYSGDPDFQNIEEIETVIV